MSMFNFLSMTDNYEDRLVKNTKIKDGVIDTAAVTDSAQPFETGIEHSRYNGGAWVIVELYDSKEEALVGHEKWVKTMSKKTLPKQLKDVSTSGAAMLCDIAYEGEDHKTNERDDSQGGHMKS